MRLITARQKLDLRFHVNIRDTDMRLRQFHVSLTTPFDTFDLHRIIAITDCENIASVALLERLGMRREGHFIQNIWFKGKWGDEYLYAILKEEWLLNSNYRHV